MEQENFNHEKSQVEAKSSLHEVTPFPKYLALALFIILPFVWWVDWVLVRFRGHCYARGGNR